MELPVGHVSVGFNPPFEDTPRVVAVNGSNVLYDPNVSLFELERKYILAALDHHGNNKQRAAEALGITQKTLYNKLHMYGLFDKYAVIRRPKK